MITVMAILGILAMGLLSIPLVVISVDGYKDSQRKKRQEEAEKKRGY